MGKKIQLCVWVIIAIAMIVLLGGTIYNIVIAKTEEPSHPEVTFEISNLGTIKMELYPEYAPNTVRNIVSLVEKGYYINKVIYGKDEVGLYVGRNQAGEEDAVKASTFDKNLTTDTDYDYAIEGEFVANGFNQNTLCHEKGIVTLLRNNYGTGLTEESYNSGTTQIAVMMSDSSSQLNGLYAAFGRITEGLELLENLYNTGEIIVEDENSEHNHAEEIERFKTYPIITSATIDTKGVNYREPKVMEIFDYDEYMYQVLNAQYGGQ